MLRTASEAFFFLPFSTPGRWLGKRRVFRDRRTVGRQNPVKRKRTESGRETSAGDVGDCPEEAGVQAVAESVRAATGIFKKNN